MSDFDVAIVGSGFAGSILARCLAGLGLRVLLVEKAHHPRFALGESSTPLAGLALERLARRWEQPELHDLATWGRWRERHPELGCGLKRGFTFFAHRPGEVFAPDPENSNRLLVAASPNDEVADVHWLRADVDHYLAELAAGAGVELLEGTEVVRVDAEAGGFRLELRRPAGSRTVRVASLVDGSGPAGAVAESLGARKLAPRVRSSLVYGHFTGVPDFAAVIAEGGGELTPGPYPDDRAAVHHLLDEGWLYLLPFADGVVSAGLVTVSEPALSPRAPSWSETLERYPSLAEQLGGAEPLFAPKRLELMQWKRDRAAGRGWTLLPHTYSFFDPIFSTGIAWSLLAVERLAEAWAEASRGGNRRLDSARLDANLARYARLVSRESERIEELVRGAYLGLGDFDAFAELSYLYFAWVSYAETVQRLRGSDDGEACWEGFLGVGDPLAQAAFDGATARLERFRVSSGAEREAARAELSAFVAEAIAPRNVAGLAEPLRRRLYPVDLELLVERAGLLGLDPAEMRRRLPGLLRA